MRLITFIAFDGQARAGALLGSTVIDLAAAAPLVLEEAADLRWDMLSLLNADQDEVNLDLVGEIVAAVISVAGGALEPDDSAGNGRRDTGMAGALSIGGAEMVLPLDQLRLLAPLPRPASLRNFATFEAHVAALQRQRGTALADEWYHLPAFSFGNHGAVYGPDADIPLPQSDALDYELGLACVIGRAGQDIAVEDAAAYIAGYTIVNDWRARDIESVEWAIGSSPAKSADFATSLGPWLVTPDELEIYADDDGQLALAMTARVNEVERSRGNAATMHYSFPQLIAHASRDTMLYPGDVLNSGAVGGGCLFEQSGGYGPWLASGDIVELEITGLGVLRNRIVGYRAG